MSVINEMLKDLDKRKSTPNPNEMTQREIIHTEKVDYKLLIIAVLITIIACVGVMTYLQSNQVTDTSNASAVIVSDADVTDINVPNNILHSNQSDLKEVAAQQSLTQKPVTPPPIKQELVAEHITEQALIKSTPDIVKETGSINKPVEVLQTTQIKAPVIEKPTSELVIAPVTLSSDQVADKKYQQAKRAIKNNKATLAEKLLEEALILSPKHIEARKQLAALWFGRNANRQAINILRQGLSSTPSNEEYRIMLARIYASQNDFNKAFDVLNERVNSASKEYQVALANMAVKTQNHNAAIIAYKKLIVINPSQGRWWLGLGIALDSNAEYPQARIAYGKAINSDSISHSSVVFAKQRLTELGE